MVKPFRTIELDKDKVYKLRLGMGQIIEFEDFTGESIDTVVTNNRFRPLVTVLWIMLKRENESLTLDQVFEMVDDSNKTIQEIVKVIGECYKDAFKINNAVEKIDPELLEVEAVPNE